MDQMRLTSHANLNDLTKDEAFDFSKEATQNALEDYAFDGGEEYADALRDYQKAMEGVAKGSQEAIKPTEEFYKRIK
jgi:hypothetical protein